jgi:hypothetical protein
MTQTIEEAKAKVAEAFLGKQGIHAVGIGGKDILVYAAPPVHLIDALRIATVAAPHAIRIVPSQPAAAAS